MKENTNIVCLEYLWWGVCVGGKHYTGSIHHGVKEVELERTLSFREAKEMGEREERMWQMRLSRKTNKFDTKQQLERAAIKWCEQNMGENWLLMYHDAINPWPPIAAKGYFKPRLRDLRWVSKMWDKVHNKRNNEEVLERIYSLYYRLIAAPVEAVS